VRLVLSYDGEVSKIVITRGVLMADYIVDDEGPPYGKIPDTPSESIGDVLQKIEISTVSKEDEIRIDSLAIIASALIQARKSLRVGLSWLVSDSDKFRNWIGVKKDVSRLLDIPVYLVSAEQLPNDKLVLLCGKTTMVNPLKADYGVLMDMGDSSGEE
jgi:hypothetical protein